MLRRRRRSFPAGIRSAYASELIDAESCDACRVVDGRTYQTMAEAIADYPEESGHSRCTASRGCLGSLVLVHESEAPPST